MGGTLLSRTTSSPNLYGICHQQVLLSVLCFLGFPQEVLVKMQAGQDVPETKPHQKLINVLVNDMEDCVQSYDSSGTGRDSCWKEHQISVMASTSRCPLLIMSSCTGHKPSCSMYQAMRSLSS